MSKIPNASSRELAPEGTHNAVLVQVIDLGTQPSAQWGDKRKVQLAFELVDEKTKDGKAMVTYKQYTFTNSPKSSLMKDLKAWLGVKDGDFDMDEALAKPALITIEHTETERGEFANITNVSGVPKGQKVKKHTEQIVSLYLDETFDQDVFDSLPDFLKEKIAGSPEYAEVMTPKLRKSKPAPAKAKR